MDDLTIFDRYYNLALRFLSYRPRSEKEIRDYLSKKIKNKKLNIKNESERENLITKIIEKLKEQKFLDDVEFARWWIESRIKHKPRAMRVIKQELKMKGISEEIIQSLGLRVKNDLESALSLAQGRIKRYEKLDKQKAYEKMARFLASKGFDWETVKKVIDQLPLKRYNK